jgi:ferric-dicitrate binding protein FerR (iron transport regulator)
MKQNWQQWIDALDRDDVSEQEISEFMDTLESSPDAKREYMEALCAEAALETEYRDPARKFGSIPMPAAAIFKISRKQWAMLAVSITLIAALSYYLGNLNTEAPIDSPSVNHVATITDTNEAADAAGLRIGNLLEVGDANSKF